MRRPVCVGAIRFALLAIVVSLASDARSQPFNPPASHTVKVTGNSHTPREADCTLCHLPDGTDKTKFWHAPGHGTPLASGCGVCHGVNLDGVGGTAPSCKLCHDRLWAGQGPPPDHTELKGDLALHKHGYQNPFIEGCTQCHGPNLNDGFAPSCFECHGPGGGPPLDHTEVLGGFAKHKLGYDDPVANGCTQCHGPNLNDGYATSCFECHGAGGTGLPATHTVLLTDETASAWHHTGYKNPAANECALCHGADLTGGIGPSCYNCHRREWADHDFSGEPWLAAEDSQCYVCHLPPAFGQPGVVWNHELPTQAPGYYTVTSSTIASVGQPQGFSAKCMGCHEGAPDGPAINDYGGATGGTEFVTGGEAFGRDLRQHHPVSFTFDDNLASLHGGLNEPSTTQSGLTSSGTIAGDMLYSGQLECTSCHDPHDYSIGQFLVKPVAESDGICFTCHIFDNPDVTQHHIPGRDDPWGDTRGTDFNCTMCHGTDLGGDGEIPACNDCHNDLVFPDAPLPGHHGGDRTKPYFDCAVCHADPITGVVTGNRFGTSYAPSCYECHDDRWTDQDDFPPTAVTVEETVDGFDHDGRSSTPAIDNVVVGTVGEAVTFTAVVTGNNDGEILAYDWSFGDGSTPPFPSHKPTVSHTYDVFNYGDWYEASVAVTDGVNPLVMHEFKVFIGEPDAEAEDSWAVTTTHAVPESFNMTFTDHNGSLVGVKDDGGLAFGIEFTGVIFWMDIWMDLSGNAYWGTGDMYFGNIDRAAGTMAGIVFDDLEGALTFTATKN